MESKLGLKAESDAEETRVLTENRVTKRQKLLNLVPKSAIFIAIIFKIRNIKPCFYWIIILNFNCELIN